MPLSDFQIHSRNIATMSTSALQLAMWKENHLIIRSVSFKNEAYLYQITFEKNSMTVSLFRIHFQKNIFKCVSVYLYLSIVLCLSMCCVHQALKCDQSNVSFFICRFARGDGCVKSTFWLVGMCDCVEVFSLYLSLCLSVHDDSRVGVQLYY